MARTLKQDRLTASLIAVRGARDDYAMANRTGAQVRARRGVPSTGATADYHYASEAAWLWMQELAWELYRNNMALGSITDRAIENQLQGGFAYDPQTGDEKLDVQLRDWWKEVSEDPRQCDLAQELCFAEQEEIVFRAVLVAGDIFGVPLEDGTVELVESYLCRSPTRKTRENIVHGVEYVPGSRRRAAYWFLNDSVNPLGPIKKDNLRSVMAWTDDGERNVFHVRNCKRANQTRGITAYAPLFDAAGYHDDVQFLKMVQARAASLFVFVRERAAAFDPAWLAAEQPIGANVNAAKQITTSDADRQYREVAAGSDIKSLPGETITPWSANIPNPEFFPHARMLLTFIGINLGMPLVMALMDASETNFSGYRGAVDQARLGFRANQNRIRRRWHTPYMRFKILKLAEEDAALGRLIDRLANGKAKKTNGKIVNPLAHRWNPPSWPYIEPTKDATADLIRESNMLISPRRRCQERGIDFEDLVRETVTDRMLAITAAIEASQTVNSEFALDESEKTHWRDFAPLPAPERTSIKLNAVSAPQPVAANEDDNG